MMFIVPVVICCLKIVTKKKLMTIYVPYAGLSYFSSASSFFKEVQKLEVQIKKCRSQCLGYANKAIKMF